VLAFGYAVLGLTFTRIVRRASARAIPALPLLELYFRGLLARYAPGKVGIPAVRMAASAEFQVSPGFMAGSVVLESLSSMATGGAVAALISIGPWASPRLRGVTAQPWTMALIAAILLGVLALALVKLRHYPSFALKLLRIEGSEEPLLPWAWLVGCTVSWLSVGTCCALCAVALSESLDTALLVAAVGVLGPLVGFIALVAPGGLGVREAFLVAVLAPQIGTTRALALGLVSRAVMLTTEFLIWLVAKLTLMARAKRA
jgi:hypothetical protein